MKNKGQLGNLQGIILAIIIVGILLGAGFFILDEFLDQSDEFPFTVLNESDVFGNSTGYTVDTTVHPGFHGFTLVAVVNASSGTTVPVANFTTTGSGTITNSTVQTYFNLEINYTYLGGRSAYIGINDSVLALLTIPELLGLIILLAMIGIILAIVFNVIPGARVSGA